MSLEPGCLSAHPALLRSTHPFKAQAIPTELAERQQAAQKGGPRAATALPPYRWSDCEPSRG